MSMDGWGGLIAVFVVLLGIGMACGNAISGFTASTDIASVEAVRARIVVANTRGASASEREYLKAQRRRWNSFIESHKQMARGKHFYYAPDEWLAVDTLPALVYR